MSSGGRRRRCAGVRNRSLWRRQPAADATWPPLTPPPPPSPLLRLVLLIPSLLLLLPPPVVGSFFFARLPPSDTGCCSGGGGCFSSSRGSCGGSRSGDADAAAVVRADHHLHHPLRIRRHHRRLLFASSSSDDRRRRRGGGGGGYAIPLLGPFPGSGGPLVPGEEIYLDSPTPFQWKALEESVVVHRNFLAKESEGDSGREGIIDAAPIVAVIDDVTGKRVRHSGSGRYATLAAAVGFTAKGKRNDRVRADDEESFFEAVTTKKREKDGALGSKVRLVGVGRAVLTDFYYKMPATQTNPDGSGGDEEEELIVPYDEDRNRPYSLFDIDENFSYGRGADDTGEVEGEGPPRPGADGYLDPTPIIMAQFARLIDEYTLSVGDEDRLGTKGARSARCSPVHAVSELHRTSNRVMWMHDERRRLAMGLTAAKARLELSDRRKRWEAEDNEQQAARAGRRVEDEGECDDHYDGLGLDGPLASSRNFAQGEEDDADSDVMSVEELLTMFRNKKRTGLIEELVEEEVVVAPPGGDDAAGAGDDARDRAKEAARPAAVEEKEVSTSATSAATATESDASPPVPPPPLPRIATMENYGLNYYSYFSKIDSLKAVALELFEPYYSEPYRSVEEYELEMFSFVAFRALVGYADVVKDVAWAVQCTSTLERLRRAYDIMLDHRRELEIMAERIGEELEECGEECTDLW